MAPTGGAGGEGSGVAPASSLSSLPGEQQPPLGGRSRRTSSKTKLEDVVPEPTLDALASALEDGNSKSDGPGATVVVTRPNRPVLDRIPSTTGFNTFTLKRSTVVKISKATLLLTILCVVVFTGLCIYGLIVMRAQRHSIAWYTGGIAVAIAVPVSLHDILMHMLHYVKPELQKFYIRVLWMVPIYAIESWLALRFRSQAIWLETLRESYEAYVIYSFFKLMLEFLGGEEGIKKHLAKKVEEGHPHPHMLFPLCRVKSWTYANGNFMENCRIGIWMYVLIRLICAIATLVSGYVASSIDSEQAEQSHAYVENTVFVLVNIGQLVAMYCLVLFYHDLYAELQPLHPLGKFLSVKAVVFFSFWQGLVIYGLVKAGVIRARKNYGTSEITAGLQDWLLCWEMAAAALAHRKCFSYHDFTEHFNGLTDRVKKSFLRQAIADMVPTDLAKETAHHVEAVKKALPSISIAVGSPPRGSSSRSPVRGTAAGERKTKEEAEGKGDDARAQAPSPVLVVTVLSEAEADTPPAQRDGIEVVQTTGTTSAEISNKVAAAGADAPTAVQHS